jgi:hypothetical protein
MLYSFALALQGWSLAPDTTQSGDYAERSIKVSEKSIDNSLQHNYNNIITM